MEVGEETKYPLHSKTSSCEITNFSSCDEKSHNFSSCDDEKSHNFSSCDEKSHNFSSCDEKSHNFLREKYVSCDFTRENFPRVMNNYTIFHVNECMRKFSNFKKKIFSLVFVIKSQVKILWTLSLL